MPSDADSLEFNSRRIPPNFRTLRIQYAYHLLKALYDTEEMQFSLAILKNHDVNFDDRIELFPYARYNLINRYKWYRNA